MSWTRLDDLFTEQPAWDDVPHDSRWHYLALVQACSRQQRWAGRLPLHRARRASDVEDPDRCQGELVKVGLLAVEGDDVVLLRIADHIPPPSVRANAEKSRIRMRRMRAHRAGDHTLCLPDRCPNA